MRTNDMRLLPPIRALAAAVLLLAAVAPPGRSEPDGILVAALLDSSGSLSARALERARRLTLEVLRGLPAGSELAVFTFDDQSRLVVPRTSRADEVERALAGVRISGRHTALYDALYDASRYLRESGAARPAILLITDGKDEQSALNLDDGLRLAQEGRIPVFAVGVGQVEERGLRRIAKLTGGQYRAADEATAADLASAMRAAAPVAPVASPSSAAAPRASPQGAQPSRHGVEPDETHSAVRPWVVMAAAIVLAAAGAVLLLSRRRRAGAPPEAATADLSSTMVSRVGGTTEEYLEKTVILREKAVLAVTRGPLAGQVFDLSPTSATSLGRSKANDLVLDDVSVSSQHCRIRPGNGGFTLMDLKSTNGTFVNERRVTSHTLAEGDVIRVGEVQLQFRTDQRRG